MILFTRLTNKDVKVFYGVIASAAYHLNIPAWILRLLYVALCFYSIFFVTFYFVSLIFSDEDSTITKERIKNKLKKQDNSESDTE